MSEEEFLNLIKTNEEEYNSTIGQVNIKKIIIIYVKQIKWCLLKVIFSFFFQIKIIKYI